MNRMRRHGICEPPWLVVFLALSVSVFLRPGTTVLGQLPLPAEINLFGDDLVRKLPQEQGGGFPIIVQPPESEAKKEAPKEEGYAQTLIFQDERRLRGEIVSLGPDEILWRRPDASEPLRFSRGEVRRMVLVPAPPAPQNFGPIVQQEEPGKVAPLNSATVKLSGADWLYGRITSADGEAFTLKLGEKAAFTIPRSQIEWLHFDAHPAPAFGFYGHAKDLDAWSGEAAHSEESVAGGRITIKQGDSLGRPVSPTARFEISFTVPENGDDGVRLWLQPYVMGPNSYTTGTVELQFGPKTFGHSVFVNNFDQKSTPLPAEAQGGDGPVSYRVLYDHPAQRLLVLRNGHQIGDLKLREASAANVVVNQEPDRQFQSICFDRMQRGRGDLLALDRIRLQPWNGSVPKAGESAPTGDLFSTDSDPVLGGKLESISETALSFSGKAAPLVAGAFVEFGHDPAPLADADCRLLFSGQGEVSAGHLRIENGAAHFATGFAPDLEMPLASLQTVSFFAPPPPSVPAPDLLVFKNGDELRGTLLSAGLGESLRWRMPGGQELDFQPARLAGIRFSTKDAAPAEGLATVEMRNGDRVQAGIHLLDGQHLEISHRDLGAISLERVRLWKLYPNPHFPVLDGARDPGAWLGLSRPKARAAGDSMPAIPLRSGWIYLDGCYISRTAGGSTYAEQAVLQAPAHDLPDRFELNCDVTHPAGGSPAFCLSLNARNGNGVITAWCSYDQVQLVVMVPRAQRGPNMRDIPLADKFSEPSSRMNLRAFVNSTAGTVDLFLNGVSIAQIGRQAGERIVGIGGGATLQAYSGDGYPMIFSNLRISPWSGEVPAAAAPEPQISLGNGDVVVGAVKGLREGRIQMESEIGALDLPVEKVQAIEFGGELAAPRPAARLRLPDGSILNVDRFHWDGHEFTATSANLGAVHLPAGTVSELILDPSPPRGPHPTVPAKPPQKTAPKADAPAIDAPASNTK